MAEASKGARAVFPLGKQQAFLEHISQKLTIAAMAHISHCSERTIRDWRREKFSIPLTAVRLLSTRANIPIPEKISIRDGHAHIRKASRMGAAATIKKYGRIPRNEKRRKERWRLWWESTGRFKKNPILEPRAVHRPNRDDNLAEFIGIMMGDGGISRYQIVITLHHTEDLEYASFVALLVKKLFKIAPSINHSAKNSVNDLTVSRKELVRYLHELGLPIGNKVKQRLDIPAWIKGDPKLAIACLRGLVDTDGCIFTHRYRAKGSWYTYKKLSFTSASKPLRKSVHTLLQKFGFHSRITDKDVRLDRVEDMERYFSIVGSHNPKHLRRYESAVG
ncbi:MAG: Lon-like ATP-dependent protease [Parcubacteria group bacterium Gr01-1014_49]|nr:MAG: Lon-like ATP-dependent protease [Parcubacteria group bacterium Gr01-1014_49]